MDDTTDVWTEVIEEKNEASLLGPQATSSILNAPKPEVSEELESLIGIAMPRLEPGDRQTAAGDTSLYELLDMVPKGRKLLAELLSGSRTTGDIFQHYEKSAIHKKLADKVDQWITEEETQGKESNRNLAGLRGEYSSAIFSWSSANKNKERVASAGKRNISSSAGSHKTVNEQLYTKAYTAISGLIAQKRDEERRREREKAAASKPPVSPTVFKADPLQKFEARALPRERKKKLKQEKHKRSSILWFWKGTPQKSKEQANKSRDDHRDDKSASETGTTSASRVPTSSMAHPESVPQAPEASACSTTASQTPEISLPSTSPHSGSGLSEASSEEESLFGDFESSLGLQAADVPATPPVASGPMGSGAAQDMLSFAPLQPKKRDNSQS
ncbi:LAQU0S11e04038g1_1 [Lachancea quebecensis]|uniref:LAQU0S11e04038g1_1 n=1 Tax=Lachancea quebecensis TaxID=1654605 RepID=A0A0P1KUS5_9SACH|nr:LAQU0S11e04038g1_1 [Lachancea quebecensis]